MSLSTQVTFSKQTTEDTQTTVIFNKKRTAEKETNKKEWSTSLQVVTQTIDSPLFYAKFLCKIGSNLPGVKPIVKPAKELIKFPNRLSQTGNLVLSIDKYNSSLTTRKIKANLKGFKETLALFKNTVSFYIMIASILSIKVSRKVSKINFLLCTILPFLNFFTKITNEGWNGIRDTSGFKSFYKMGKTLLNLYLLYSMTRLDKRYTLALTIADFALAHLP